MRSRTVSTCAAAIVIFSALVPLPRTLAEMQFEIRPLGGTYPPSTGNVTNDVAIINSLRRSGQFEEAQVRCLELLKQRPDDPGLKALFLQIQSDRRTQSSSSIDLKTKIKDIIVPEINVREAAVGDVIDFLRGQGQSLSPDKAPVNIVWQAPEEAKNVKITLNLRDVPLADALKYATQSAGLRYRIDPHVVVIYSASPTVPGNSSPSHVKP